MVVKIADAAAALTAATTGIHVNTAHILFRIHHFCTYSGDPTEEGHPNLQGYTPDEIWEEVTAHPC